MASRRPVSQARLSKIVVWMISAFWCVSARILPTQNHTGADLRP
jgi:hypothetical protein